MKKIFQLVALAVTSLAFVGCVTANHSEFDTARAQSDSIQLRAKDSLLNEAFSSIEQISNALSQITQRERIVASTSAGEINKSAKDRIAENIAAISELLQQNRASINRLSASAKKLRAANAKVEALESLVASYEKQISEKDAQIAQMAQQLDGLQVELAELKGLNATLAGQKNQLSATVAAQTAALNTVYFVMGQERDLIKGGIITKKGFDGRSLGEGADMRSFNRADLRKLDCIEIGKKGVKLLSAHPAESYIMVMGGKNTVNELVISDKAAFWSVSKVLVISYR